MNICAMVATNIITHDVQIITPDNHPSSTAVIDIRGQDRWETLTQTANRIFNTIHEAPYSSVALMFDTTTLAESCKRTIQSLRQIETDWNGQKYEIYKRFVYPLGQDSKVNNYNLSTASFTNPDEDISALETKYGEDALYVAKILQLMGGGIHTLSYDVKIKTIHTHTLMD